jgi:hypothetical protein
MSYFLDLPGEIRNEIYIRYFEQMQEQESPCITEFWEPFEAIGKQVGKEACSYFFLDWILKADYNMRFISLEQFAKVLKATPHQYHHLIQGTLDLCSLRDTIETTARKKIYYLRMIAAFENLSACHLFNRMQHRVIPWSDGPTYITKKLLVYTPLSDGMQLHWDVKKATGTLVTRHKILTLENRVDHEASSGIMGLTGNLGTSPLVREMMRSIVRHV